MSQVNMFEAKTTLSKLVDLVESGQQKEIVIARNGRPAARLVPMRPAAPTRRIGVARGRFQVPDDIDQHNAEVAGLLLGSEPA